MARILLIEDDPIFGELLQEKLSIQRHAVHSLHSAEEGLKLLSNGADFDLVLLDYRLPGMTGIEFLSQRPAQAIHIPVILMTEAHTDQTAIKAETFGATYVIKPMDFEKILEEMQPEIDKALRLHQRAKSVPLQPAPGSPEPSVLVGTSKPMLEVLKQIGKAARSDLPVLILGETGTGKDLVAQAIHKHSRRKDRFFVPRNCAAFSENLLEDELFGHEVGTYTGANKLRKGLFEYADGGTVFLDEVAEMTAKLQVKLLRVVENQEVVRPGRDELIKVDVRVISATHCDLGTAVREGRFRRDLYYRLVGITIHLPPLRDRKEDIGLLAARILGGEPSPRLHPLALEKLMNYHWPGNIRELQQVLRVAMSMCRGAEIMPEDVDFGKFGTKEYSSPNNSEEAALANLRAAIAWACNTKQDKLLPFLQEQLERETIQFAREQLGLSEVQLAKRLGIARGTLRKRLKKYGLNPPPAAEE